MKLGPKPSAVSSLVVMALAAVLVILAILQYQGSREVSEAAGARMKASLQNSMLSFRQDLHRELGVICTAFQGDTGTAREALSRYSLQYDSWRATATHPELVANVFVFEDAGGKDPRFLRLDRSSRRFVPVAWPDGFSPLQERLTAISSDLGAIARFRPPDETRRRADHSAAATTEHHGPPNPPWWMEQNIPALVHVVYRPAANAPGTPAAGMDWIIIELDRKVLDEQLLPELTERHFSGAGGLEYQVAVVGAADPRRVIYATDPGFGAQGDAGMDATFPVFGGPGPGARGMFLPRPSSPDNPRRLEARSPRIEPMRYAGADGDWLLVAKHRRGSLDAVVAATRRRSLTINFGVLLVLAATMAMIIVASQRAHRLAKLQIDFVAGVSHELRTPLAVISSAADNLADGVVSNPQQLTRYGKVIKKQSAQLSALVEQIMLFAASRNDKLTYSLGPVAVPEVIAMALSNTAELIHGAGFTVEQKIEPDLPSVMGEMQPLSQCLQNLITNAVKYGGVDRWIGIRAARVQENGGAPEVRISIADHGDGVAHSELQRIFEPFYRSPAVTAAQIHGSGLGLPLARSIATAMGGRIVVASEPGKGSVFTLYLRAVGPAEPAAEASATAGSASSPRG